MCIQLGLLKMAVNEVFCQRPPYFRSFLAKATSNLRTVGGFINRACLRENIPYGILLTVVFIACTVITFARMIILQYFENGIQLLTFCIFIV